MTIEDKYNKRCSDTPAGCKNQGVGYLPEKIYSRNTETRWWWCAEHYEKHRKTYPVTFMDFVHAPPPPPVNAAYITKHFLPLETAIYGVNKKTEPTHERVGTRVYSASTEVLGKKDVLKSAVAQAVSKLESDRKKTYYWNPEYIGDGSLD